jgi:hypothetical protein
MLQELSKNKLQKIAKIASVPRYTRMTKDQLVTSLQEGADDMKVRDLRAMAKEVGQTGYSKLNKTALIALMGLARQATPPNNSPQPQDKAPSASASINEDIERGLTRGQLRARRKQLRSKFGPPRWVAPGHFIYGDGFETVATITDGKPTGAVLQTS